MISRVPFGPHDPGTLHLAPVKVKHLSISFGFRFVVLAIGISAFLQLN